MFWHNSEALRTVSLQSDRALWMTDDEVIF